MGSGHGTEVPILKIFGSCRIKVKSRSVINRLATATSAARRA